MIAATRDPVLRSPPLLFGVVFLLFMTTIILFRVSDVDAAKEPEAMTFRYTNDHFTQLGMDFRLVYVTGLFVEGAATKFRLFVEQNNIKDGAVVILESDGGSVAEALRMGRVIRQMGFDTEVNTHCFSSCTLAFLGGVRRNVRGVGAEFGVHRVSTNARLDPAQALAELRRLAGSRCLKLLFFGDPTGKGRHYSGVGGWPGSALILGFGCSGRANLSLWSRSASSGSGSV
jgi:hypothetical protein